MYIALVDDDRQDAKCLMNYIADFAEETAVELQMQYFSSAIDFLTEDFNHFSMIILDIDMPGINGMDCARRIREKNPDLVLMFVTNMPQYALAGYEVDAVDYILKPVSYGDFSLKFRKALRYVRQNMGQNIVLQASGETIQIPIWELLYVESNRHYLIYHTIKRDIKIRGTMTEAEVKLGPNQFVRCNIAYLVNMRRITSIGREEVFLGEISLKISRGFRKELLDRYMAYVGGLDT